MTRVLLVPAAGLGTRLRSPLPKLLTPVAGRAMVDRVLDLHASFCAHAVVVVHPSFQQDVAEHFARAGRKVRLVSQPAPTGMLDAVLRAREAVMEAKPARVWITWCDQLALSAATLATIAAAEAASPDAAAIAPTSRHSQPYIHFDRDDRGTLRGVRQRREGDEMPLEGESDAGLFSLSSTVYAHDLPAYAETIAARGRKTGELNFLPFLPWLAARAPVTTFQVEAIEALGINTPEDLTRIEQHLHTLNTP